MENEKQRGNISVEAENIFPVIKKWLYSDKEIFLRELVSNACDAVTKMRRLASLGQREEAEDEQFRVDVVLDKEAGTLTVSDNGVGMTREEVEKYICSIARSGAVEFMEKYEKESSGDGIIGHFGLGFYSAFMVADKVELRTRSYLGGETTLWICDGDGAYTFEQTSERAGGTDVILYIDSEEGKEFLEEGQLRAVLDKYCSFMPVDIFFSVVGKEKKEDEKEEPINDTQPLWQKNSSDITPEEYNEFYQKVFNDYKEPLFQIHLNVDYPISFKGILYFPKINPEFENPEGQIKLYYNGVFVADNIKEVIPEYFLMLKGVLDCPELPLNVSRSYLQNSGYVKKIAAHIVKKTADKLTGMYNTERDRYEKIWDDVKIFVEYGCLKDEKFYDKLKDVILYKTTAGKYLTLEEYKKDASDDKIYYCTDQKEQAQYLPLYKEKNIDVLLLDRVLDAQFISMIERKTGVKFLRVDADPASALKSGEDSKDENADKERITALFKEAVGNEELKIETAALENADMPALVKISEDMRRMNDFMRMYGVPDTGAKNETILLLNENSPLYAKLSACEDEEKAKLCAKQIYLYALLFAGKLDEKETAELLKLSQKTLYESL